MMTCSSPSSTLTNNNEFLVPLPLHTKMVNSKDINVSAEAMAWQLYLDQSVLTLMHYTWPTGITTIAAHVGTSTTHQ
jgi:hypothetical protein